jgi:gluconate 2-dehydrogenase gamma chain
MSDINKLSRKDFIKISAMSLGALSFMAGGLSFIEGCRSTRQPGIIFFTQDELKLVEAIAEQIIPTDDWPGGRDAGVANFINIQLIGPLCRFQNDYHKGLSALQNTCQNEFHNNFEKLPWDTQTIMLKNMEAGKMDGGVWKNGFAENFFQLLLAHSMQGYYGSPRHGGNKNFISYKMIGLDEPQIIGENRDNKI